MLKQNPFSFYDFLGYFIPGAFFVYFIIFFFGREISFCSEPNPNISDKIAGFHEAIFVIISYTSGHILSFVSSITIERLSIWRFGYPSEYLLGTNNKQCGFFKNKYKFKNTSYFYSTLRFLVAWVLLLPLTLLDNVLGYQLGYQNLYAKELDPKFVGILKNEINDLLGKDTVEDGDDGGHDFLRRIYHYAVEKCPNHLPKMQNYVALYGFLRSICFIFLLVFWFIFGEVIRSPDTNGILLVLFLILLIYLSYLAFLKFYRRFSLEALMAFHVNRIFQSEK